MKIKTVLLVTFLFASYIFPASATFPSITAGYANGNVLKVIYAGAGLSNTANAVFFEVTCGAGCINTYWVGLEEKNALSILLTAKSTNQLITVLPSTTSNGMVKLNNVYCNHADFLYIN